MRRGWADWTISANRTGDVRSPNRPGAAKAQPALQSAASMSSHGPAHIGARNPRDSPAAMPPIRAADARLRGGVRRTQRRAVVGGSPWSRAHRQSTLDPPADLLVTTTQQVGTADHLQATPEPTARARPAASSVMRRMVAMNSAANPGASKPPCEGDSPAPKG